jgi:hypothetical protein
MKIEDLTGRGVTPFFSITVPEPTAKTKAAPPKVKLFDDADLQGKVSSLTIDEAEGSPPMVTLSLLDDTGRINKKYTYGFNVEIEYGLKKSDQSLIPSFLKPSNPNEIKGDYRRKIKAHFLNYSPAGAEGIVLSSIQMRGAEIGGYNKVRKIFKSEKPKDVVAYAIAQMKMKAVIDFPGMDIPLNKKNFIVQNYESYWAFLRRLSFRYDSKLVMQGDTVFFIAWEKQHDIKYAEFRGAEGVYHNLDYGTVNGGIISFSFDANSNSTNGSSISIVTGPDGVSQTSFSPSPTENVEIWELDSNKIKAALKKGTIKDKMKLLAEVESAGFEDLDRLKKLYFTPRKTTTAPEGYGATGKLKILPNPNIVCGDYLFLGSPKSLIPPQFKSREKSASVGFAASVLNPKPPEVEKRTLWRITKGKTVIDAGNYSMELEVAR